MMRMINRFLLFFLLVSCGKIEQVQESFIAMSGNNDLVQVDVRIGALYRNDPTTQPQGYDFLNFENTQYRIGNVSSDVAQFISTLPKGQLVQVYFKGSFGKRSGVSNTNPTVAFDVIDLTGVSRK
ncbi:MAG: hypothetical protein K2P81_06960 [Bacteriovoracaceae bacterium]|nr:hypothetical protein [Bacteriovoracaceae bacterium]